MTERKRTRASAAVQPVAETASENTRFRVKLSKVGYVAGMPLSPALKITVSAEALEELKAQGAIESVEEV